MKWSRIVVTRVSPQDFEHMQQLATKRGLTLTSFIRSIILETLQKEEQNQQRGA